MASLRAIALSRKATPKEEGALARAVARRRDLTMSAALFAGAFALLLLLQLWIGIQPLGVSLAPHYVDQAYSFLHGRLSLMPGVRLHDTVVVNGARYLVYPPFPALLLLPFVAVFGLRTSDILFTALVSALGLPLLYLLFERVSSLGLARRSGQTNVLLAALFYFGSINLWLSLDGRVWFTEQIVTFACTLLSLLLALHRRWLLSAIALACAFFTRGTLALGFPFLLALAWFDLDPAGWILPAWAHPRAWRSAAFWQRARQTLIPRLRQSGRVRRVAPVVGVMVVSVVLFLVRDELTFHSPFETGYGLTLIQNYPGVQYGVYSWHYVWMNVVANFLDVPHVIFKSSTDLHPTIDLVNGGIGISVFVTTPLFLLLFWRNARVSPLRAALWATIGLMVAQVLLYDWTGYSQFGARYLFDAYPYAFLLFALNEVRVDWRVVALGFFGIVVNVAGAIQFWTKVLGL